MNVNKQFILYLIVETFKGSLLSQGVCVWGVVFWACYVKIVSYLWTEKSRRLCAAMQSEKNHCCLQKDLPFQ